MLASAAAERCYIRVVGGPLLSWDAGCHWWQLIMPKSQLVAQSDDWDHRTLTAAAHHCLLRSRSYWPAQACQPCLPVRLVVELVLYFVHCQSTTDNHQSQHCNIATTKVWIQVYVRLLDLSFACVIANVTAINADAVVAVNIG